MSVLLDLPQQTQIVEFPTHRRRQFTLAEYERMIASGILTEQDRCELIRGGIVEKMTVGEAHAACVKRLNHLLTRLVGDRAILSVQDPVVVAGSRPEPDVALLIPRDDFFSESAPEATDILLVIEVADSSLPYVRTVKLSLYAEARVGEYWIANLDDRCIEVYRDPQPDGTYASRQMAHRGEVLNIAGLPGVAVNIDDIFTARRGR